MGKRVGHHTPLTLLLQTIIANGIGRVERFFDIARLQPVQSSLCMVGPDAGQAIGLQFLTHQQAAIAFHLPALLARCLNFRGNAEQGLHVVSDFVSDHVGLGEVPAAEKRWDISWKNAMSR